MRYLTALLMMATPVLADAPVITAAELEDDRVRVTITHPDTGWDHYADAFEVLDADGNSLGVRTLLHPHIEEQPFTRSLTDVAIPDGAEAVFVRARCNVDGWSSTLFEIRLRD